MNTAMKDQLKPFVKKKGFEKNGKREGEKGQQFVPRDLIDKCKDLAGLIGLVYANQENAGLDYLVDNLSYVGSNGEKVGQLALVTRRPNVGMKEAERSEMNVLASAIGNYLIQNALVTDTLTGELQFNANFVQGNCYRLIRQLRKVLPYEVNPSITYVLDKAEGTCHQYFMVNCTDKTGAVQRVGVRVMQMRTR